MLAKIQSYALITLLAFSVVAGGASVYLWNRNSALSEELRQKSAVLEKAQRNLILVSDQLARERENREAAEAALSELREVPDVDYNTPLPPSIGNVLNNFRERMQ